MGKHEIKKRALLWACFFIISFPVTSKPSLAEQDDLDRKITAVWRQCEREGVRDYDGNGRVNCCDRATAFCIKWNRQYGNKVRLAQQMTRKIDHMYVLMETQYGWWAIDPAYSVYGRHDMKTVWGDRYVEGADDVNAYWVRHFSKYIW